MIPIAIAFLLLMLLIVRQYGGHRFGVFLILLVVFWLVAFTSSVLIVGNQSAFFMLGPQVLPLDWFLIRRLPALSRQTPFLVSLNNVSTVAFYYSFLAFTLLFSQLLGDGTRRVLIGLAIPSFIVAVVFDPSFIRLLSRLNATRLDSSYFEIGQVMGRLRQVARAVFALYFAGGILLMAKYCLDRPRTRRVQRSVSNLSFATGLFATVFAVSFYKSPQLITVPTVVDPFVRVGFYELPIPLAVLRIFPHVQVFAFVVLILGIARFLKLASSDSFYESRVRHGLRAASMGSRVIGHAVKNQLFAIESKLNSLRDTLSPASIETRDELERIVSMCQKTYQSMGRAIDMLQAPKLHMERTDLSALVDELVSKWRSAYQDIDLLYECDSPSAMAFLDKTHFSESIVNLLNNSRQATVQAGRRRVSVQVVADTLWISVRIVDEGTGIDEADSAQLFEPFFTRNNHASSWGIGLTYCRTVIDAHGGSIEIRNGPSTGAQVELSIPRADTWR